MEELRATKLNTGAASSDLVKLRAGTEDPVVAMSATGSKETKPAHAKPTAVAAESACVMLRDSMSEPVEAKAEANTTESTRAGDRKSKDKSSWQLFSTDAARPSCARLRKGNEDSAADVPGAKTRTSGHAKPQIATEASSLPGCCNGRLDPNLEGPGTDNKASTLEGLRNGTTEPRLPSLTAEGIMPKQANPHANATGSVQAELRRGNRKPGRADDGTRVEVPGYEELCGSKALPRVAISTTSRGETKPARPKPVTNAEGPSCTGDCIGKGKPKCTKLDTSNAKPTRAGERMNAEESKLERSNARSDKPKRVVPTTEAKTPSRAKFRSSVGGPNVVDRSTDANNPA